MHRKRNVLFTNFLNIRDRLKEDHDSDLCSEVRRYRLAIISFIHTNECPPAVIQLSLFIQSIFSPAVADYGVSITLTREIMSIFCELCAFHYVKISGEAQFVLLFLALQCQNVRKCLRGGHERTEGRPFLLRQQDAPVVSPRDLRGACPLWKPAHDTSEQRTVQEVDRG